MDIIAATYARSKFLELVDEADRFLKRYIITKRGKPLAVLLSAEEFESWEETLYTLSRPQTMRAIREGERDWKAKRKEKFITLKELREKIKK
jgi:prevent-host-death family protein